MASQVDNIQYQDNARVQRPDKKSGGFACEIVDPPPEHLLQTECPVCLLTIREPHQVTCCGYSFCHSCIQQIKDKNKPCPTCKKEGFSDFPDMRLKRALYALKVHCSHQKDGCEWTGELGQLDAHLNEDPEPEKQLNGCQFVEIDCLYECGDRLQRRYMHKHQTELCTKRPFSCEHCHNYESNYDDVIHNHWPGCGSFPLHCPNQCGSFPQRQNIENHIDNECPLTTISCDFHHAGCTVKLPRKDMPEHLRENLITHMSLLATNQAKHQTKYQAEIARQQARLTEHQDEITKHQAEITKQKDKISEQQTQIAQFRDRNVTLEQKLKSMQAEVTALKQENATLRSETKCLKTTQSRLRDEVAGMKEQSKQPELTLKAELSAHVVPRTTMIPQAPPVLTMTNFQQHKRDGDEWYSPLVYTHHQGYKICLRVDANGNGGGKGTHVSAFICFKRGEFDEHLKWPFRGVITFGLLDQVKGEDHVTKELTYDDSVPDRYCIRVTSGETSDHGWGYATFIAHSELEPTYLQKDTLFIQIYKIQLK